MNRIPEKLRNMGCKVTKKQCFTDYVSYLSIKYLVIFLEYGPYPVTPLLSSNSVCNTVNVHGTFFIRSNVIFCRIFAKPGRKVPVLLLIIKYSIQYSICIDHYPLGAL
jgi:hypothetical protein